MKMSQVFIYFVKKKKKFNNNEDKDPDSGFEWKKKQEEM